MASEALEVHRVAPEVQEVHEQAAPNAASEEAHEENASVQVRHWLTGRSVVSRLTTWRMPKAADEMPAYVVRAFRVKTFGLMTCQQAICFAIVLQIHLVHEQEVLLFASLESRQAVCYALGLLNMASLMSLWILKARYPHNFMLLAIITILSGLFWGLTGRVMETVMHLQVLAMVGVTTLVVTVLSWLFTRETFKCIQPAGLIFVSILAGWTFASVANMLLAMTVSPMGGMFQAMTSSGFAGLLFILLLLEAHEILFACRPDDVMKVVTILNSCLLVIVSIPFFIFLFCFMHASSLEPREQEREQSRDQERAQPPAIVEAV